MTESSRTVSQAQVASLTGVARAAVTQWRQRHDSFPSPVDGAGGQFDLDEIIGWLDGRRIPVHSRDADEVEGATYGDRARRRLGRVAPTIPNPLLRSLQDLGGDVGGVGTSWEYRYLLHCLAYLRLHDRKRWADLARRASTDGDPSDARRLLRRVVAAVDESLGYPNILNGPDVPPARLRPPAWAPVRKVMELVARLRPDDLAEIRLHFVRAACVDTDWILTPTSITRTMTALLASHVVDGEVTVYDPFARYGEVLAQFAADYPNAVARLIAENPNPAQLRLAGMWLAAGGARAELATASQRPTGGATFVVTNPPFGKKAELTWLQRCIETLADNGRAAVLMPYGAGFIPGARAYDFRRDLVERGQVLAVVALPPKMFPGLSIGVAIWLLRPPRERAEPILLVDARSLGRQPGKRSGVHVIDAADIATIVSTVAASDSRPGFSVLVSPDEIRAHEYSLNPLEYQNQAFTQTPSDIALAELSPLLGELDPLPFAISAGARWPRRRLRDLCEIGIGVSHASLKKAIQGALSAPETVPVVHPRHLRNGRIQPGGMPDADVASVEQYRLRAHDVLWVRTGAMGQPAMVRQSEAGWLPHTNLLRLRVTATAEIDPAYLFAYLLQPSVGARIKDRSVKSTSTSLNLSTFGDFEIPLPPLIEQRRILNALHELDKQKSAIERRMAAARAARAALGRHLTDGTVVLAREDRQ